MTFDAEASHAAVVAIRAEPRPEITETPNPDATVPTGMCGSPKKCNSCPSTFLCYTKASDERDIIRARG